MRDEEAGKDRLVSKLQAEAVASGETMNKLKETLHSEQEKHETAVTDLALCVNEFGDTRSMLDREKRVLEETRASLEEAEGKLRDGDARRHELETKTRSLEQRLVSSEAEAAQVGPMVEQIRSLSIRAEEESMKTSETIRRLEGEVAAGEERTRAANEEVQVAARATARSMQDKTSTAEALLKCRGELEEATAAAAQQRQRGDGLEIDLDAATRAGEMAAGLTREVESGKKVAEAAVKRLEEEASRMRADLKDASGGAERARLSVASLESEMRPLREEVNRLAGASEMLERVKVSVESNGK